MLQKLKGYRSILVALLGLAPAIADYAGAVDFDSGTLVAVETGVIALLGVLRLFTNTAPFKAS